MTTDEIIEAFRESYVLYHRISDARAREQHKVLLELARRLEPRSLQEVTQDDFQAFANELQTSLHVNTVRKKLNMARPFFSWAYAANLIDADRYLRLRMVKDPRGASGRSKPNPYTPDEVRAFWAAVETRLPLQATRGKGSLGMRRWIQGKSPFRVVAVHGMRLQVEAIARLALDCGLRRSEIYRLDLRRAHYDNAYVLVDGAAKGKNFDRDMERQVPFTREARKAMHAWIEFRALMRPEHDALWVACYGPLTHANPMSEDRFGHLLAAVVGEGWELQRFRHTCATEWLRAGAALQTVSDLLGHENLQQTRAYTEIVGSDIERELAKVEDNFSRRLRRAA